MDSQKIYSSFSYDLFSVFFLFFYSFGEVRLFICMHVLSGGRWDYVKKT